MIAILKVRYINISFTIRTGGRYTKRCKLLTVGQSSSEQVEEDKDLT